MGFIGVFVLSSDDDIKKFVDTFKITFPVGKDKGLAEMLDVTVIPVTVFIDKRGRILKRHIGPVTYGDLSSAIEASLK